MSYARFTLLALLSSCALLASYGREKIQYDGGVSVSRGDQEAVSPVKPVPVDIPAHAPVEYAKVISLFNGFGYPAQDLCRYIMRSYGTSVPQDVVDCISAVLGRYMAAKTNVLAGAEAEYLCRAIAEAACGTNSHGVVSIPYSSLVSALLSARAEGTAAYGTNSHGVASVPYSALVRLLSSAVPANTTPGVPLAPSGSYASVQDSVSPVMLGASDWASPAAQSYSSQSRFDMIKPNVWSRMWVIRQMALEMEKKGRNTDDLWYAYLQLFLNEGASSGVTN